MRRIVTVALAIAVVLGTRASLLLAQAGPSELGAADQAARAFAAGVVSGVAAFQDRSAAIAAGFKRVGTDFPSMGEHWVSTTRVLEDRFDVAQPAMLSYAQVSGRPRLIGVVYLVPLGHGEFPPALPEGLKASWHEHNGTVEEESRSSDHAGEQMMEHAEPRQQGGHDASSARSVRVAILHAWVLLPNPDGLFTADNWALPFYRLGLEVPAAFAGGAARALSLVSGGDRFYLDVIRSNGHADREAEVAARAALADCRATADAIVARPRAAPVLSSGDLADLDASWQRLLVRLDATVGAKATAALRPGPSR